MATRITNQQTLAYVPHSSVEGEAWQLTFRSKTTGNGAAGGTTLVDARRDAGSADAYNGRYWVRLIEGDNQDKWKRIVDDDGSGTLTLEGNGFPNQVEINMNYEVWKSPEPVIVVDSSGSGSSVVDGVRVEADDFWTGYYMIVIQGTYAGEIQRISDYVSATGTFTLSPGFTAALTAGDVCVIRKFVEVGNASNSLTRGYAPALQVRQNMSEGDGVVTERGGSFSFDTDVAASGVETTTDQPCGMNPYSGLFQGAGFEEIRTTATAIANNDSTTINLEIAAGQNEDYRLGAPVMVNGQMAWVSGFDDAAGTAGADIIKVRPALNEAPTNTNSDILYGGILYEKSTDADTLPVVLEWEVDGERITMTGCKGNVTLNDPGTGKLSFSWEFQIDHWMREIEAASYTPLYTAFNAASVPIISSDRRAYLDNDTKADINGFTASLNTAVAPRMIQGNNGINGRAGFQITGYAGGGTFNELLDASGDLDQDQRFGTRTSYAIMVMYGSHQYAFGVRMPVARLVEDPNTADDNGLRSVPSVWRAHDAGTATGEDTTTKKVPDFAFGFL